MNQTLSPLSKTLLLQAPNNRHGITLEPQQAYISQSDVQGIVHMGVPSSVQSPWESASGGVARVAEDAQLAAIGESIERYCATIADVPIKTKLSLSRNQRVDAESWHLFTADQRSNPLFPFEAIYSEACKYTNMYDFQDNQERWVPHPFVVLRDDYQTGVPTSSGLAAGPSAEHALLRAVQELIERDALMVTWLHGVIAQSIKLPKKYLDEVAVLQGEVWAFDITPAYSPFPVIAVAGGIQKKGKRRYSLGVACRNTWEEALDKAYLEWNQGVLFAGIYDTYVDTSQIKDPGKLKSFDEHAIFYTLYPDAWDTIPMFKHKALQGEVRLKGKQRTNTEALQAAKSAFAKHAIRMYYRDLTTLDAEQLGVRVLRVASPDLAPIFAHQEWPLLGRVAELLQSRYPSAQTVGAFPNLMPHPLG